MAEIPSISDIRRLKWKNIVKTQKGWALDFTTQKTDYDALLPISDEAVEFCGERGNPEDYVFPGLKHHVIQKNLKPWIEAAGITKHITFHCFRHTFATLQVTAGTDIYVISKMLTHSNVTVTQIYADVVNEKKQEAANKVTLKKKEEPKASEKDAEQSSSIKRRPPTKKTKKTNIRHPSLFVCNMLCFRVIAW